jgi:D-sedoheptulose 7-phosphate isomerase
MNFKKSIGRYLNELSDVIGNLDHGQIDSAMNALMDAYRKEGRVFVFGNGGSAATASHFVCDFNKGASMNLEKRFDLICLNDNVPTVLAIANDCGYENIFFVQLKNKLKKNDIILAISGSGNSPNVIKAVKYAKERGNKVIALTGYDGGSLMMLADHPIHVNVNDMQKVEDVHMILDHLMSQIIAEKLGHKMC